MSRPVDPGVGIGPTRRTTLRAAAGLVIGIAATAISGCGVRLNNPFTAPSPTPAAVATPDLDPDVATAVGAVVAIRQARALLDATRARHPGLGDALEPLAAMHDAHLAALIDAVPDGVALGEPTPPATIRARRKRARATVVDHEHDLHDRFVAWAVVAESGPFARLLGAMAAAVSQRLVVLDR